LKTKSKKLTRLTSNDIWNIDRTISRLENLCKKEYYSGEYPTWVRLLKHLKKLRRDVDKGKIKVCDMGVQ
jgi:hypothetical protein